MEFFRQGLRYPLSFLKVINRKFLNASPFSDEYVQFYNQEANDFIREQIENHIYKSGYMIAKFGTYELENLLYFSQNNKTFVAYKDMVNCIRKIYWTDVKKYLPNTGFFPMEQSSAKKLAELYMNDIPQIDVLGSYIKAESYLQGELKNAVRVNLEGYYAPYLWKNPWTKSLEGKKVLVVHPFTESIKTQYKKRQFLFEDTSVLPEFSELLTVKAVQSIANSPSGFTTWFDALSYMEKQISELDFDIALIGCGAYGLPLAAHIKRMGKIAVHLAGWTQMLFGIYGNRWIHEQTKFKKFINNSWIKPSKEETPQNFTSVENGCYW